MALPSSGQLSAGDVYEERFGNGATPGSPMTLEQLQADWQLPETPDNGSIFYDKGRPEGSTSGASGVGTTEATLNGGINNAGGYSQIDCDWRFRYQTGGGSYNYTSGGTVGGTYTGSVSEVGTFGADTTYTYWLQLRNIHDDGLWQTFNSRTFTTDPFSCLIKGTEVTMADGSIKYIEDLKAGDKLMSVSIQGLKDTNNVEQLFKWQSKTMKKLEVPGTIKDISHKIVEKTIEINHGVLRATGSHTQLIRRNNLWRFISLEDIAVGDFIFHTREGLMEVDNVETVVQPCSIYKLTMEGPTHTFYANRVLTHNIKPV